MKKWVVAMAVAMAFMVSGIAVPVLGAQEQAPTTEQAPAKTTKKKAHVKRVKRTAKTATTGKSTKKIARKKMKKVKKAKKTEKKAGETGR